MNYRIDPSELVPKPGARERILVEAPRLFEASKNVSGTKFDPVDEWLRSAIPLPASRADRSIFLVTEICRKHGITIEQMRSCRRMKHLVQARKEAVYVLRISQRHLSMNAIARIVGYSDHTTVHHHLVDYSRRHGVPYPSSDLRAQSKTEKAAA